MLTLPDAPAGPAEPETTTPPPTGPTFGAVSTDPTVGALPTDDPMVAALPTGPTAGDVSADPTAGALPTDPILDLRRSQPWLATLALLALPLLLYAVLLLFIAWTYPTDFRAIYGLLLVFMFTPVGKFTAGAFIAKGIGVWETVLILGTVDVLVGLFLVLNFPFLYAIPRLGPALARIEGKGRALLMHHDWVRRLAILGLAALVAIPFQGTGSVAGSFAGRMLGVGPWRTLAAIALGGFVGTALVAGASFGIAGAFRADAGLGTTLVVGLGVALALAGVYWRSQNRKTPAEST